MQFISSPTPLLALFVLQTTLQTSKCDTAHHQTYFQQPDQVHKQSYQPNYQDQIQHQSYQTNHEDQINQQSYQRNYEDNTIQHTFVDYDGDCDKGEAYDEFRFGLNICLATPGRLESFNSLNKQKLALVDSGIDLLGAEMTRHLGQLQKGVRESAETIEASARAANFQAVSSAALNTIAPILIVSLMTSRNFFLVAFFWKLTVHELLCL